MSPAFRRRRNFRVLWATQFISTAGLTVAVPLLPFYLETLGVFGGENHWWTGLCLSAPAITLFLASPLWGKVGDRWGRKWMVVRAVFGLSASMILMGFAQTAWHLLLFRLIQGAFGGVVDAAAAFASSEAPAEKQGRTFGSFQGATAAGVPGRSAPGWSVGRFVGISELASADGGIDSCQWMLGSLGIV